MNRDPCPSPTLDALAVDGPDHESCTQCSRAQRAKFHPEEYLPGPPPRLGSGNKMNKILDELRGSMRTWRN